MTSLRSGFHTGFPAFELRSQLVPWPLAKSGTVGLEVSWDSGWWWSQALRPAGSTQLLCPLAPGALCIPSHFQALASYQFSSTMCLMDLYDLLPCQHSLGQIVCLPGRQVWRCVWAATIGCSVRGRKSFTHKTYYAYNPFVCILYGTWSFYIFVFQY